MELVQVFFNQPLLLFFAHLALMISILIWSYSVSHPYFFCFLLICYECLETASWVTVGTNICFQVINAIDLQYVFKTHPEFLIYAAVACFLIFVFFNIPIPQRTFALISSWMYLVIVLIISLLYFFSISLYHSFYPFNDMFFSMSDLSPTAAKIAKALSMEPKILSISKKLRNLVLFQVESLERGPIGTYNTRFPESMPYLSRLSNESTIFDNLDSQPYTTWTASGTFVTQCGFPQVISDPLYWKNRKHAHITQWEKLPCLPTFLKMAGYNMFSYMVGSNKIMGLKKFLIDKGYKTYDIIEHQINHDFPLLEMVKEKVLPDLIQNYQPFVLHLRNEDTHPMFYTDPICRSDNFPPGKEIPPIISAFNCLDQMIENFTKKMTDLGLNNENTLYVIYGDHICFGDKTNIYNDRKLVNIFPFMPKLKSSKKGTYYDFVPTLLNQLGILYQPEFPFGDDLFSNSVGAFPDDNDFMFIYGIYAKQMHKSAEIKCKDKEGFCKGYM